MSTHSCSWCQKSFDSGFKLGGHVSLCRSNPNYKPRRRHVGPIGPNPGLSATIRAKVANGTWHTSFSKKRIKEYRGSKFDGTWELKLAMWFDSKGIPWERNTRRFPYTFEGVERTYVPDFYLPAANCFVEVKGWRVPKDEAKWSQFPETIIVFSGADLESLGIDVGHFRDWRK